MNGTLVRATALALLSMLLAGCGGGDGDATPTFSSTPTPTAQTTSASPVISSLNEPQEMPDAFVRRWNDESTRMQNTGDISAYQLISQGCSACETVASLVKKYYAAGGSVQTKGWEIDSLTCKKLSATSTKCVGKMFNTATTYTESAGGPSKRLPAGHFSEIFSLTLLDTGWQMTSIAELAT